MPAANSLAKGAVAGLAAGLAASLAMDLFQRATQSLLPPSDAEPATEQAADAVAEAATGAPVPDEDKPMAGQAIHYAFGALLGLSYGVAAELSPQATAGHGGAFGLGAAMLFDEAAVPAAGLSGPPTDTPPAVHLYGLASHLVFGLVAETVRRATRHALA